MWRLCLSCGEEKALQTLPISFLVPPPHTQRLQIHAGQLLTEDVTRFLPGLVDTSYKLATDHRREAGATITKTTPFCAASAVSLLWDASAVSNHTPASQPCLAILFPTATDLVLIKALNWEQRQLPDVPHHRGSTNDSSPPSEQLLCGERQGEDY